jgi:hypothetical protein
VTVGVALLGAVLGLRRSSRVWLLAGLWLASFIGMWVFLFRPHIVEDRYMFWGMLPLGLFAGLAFDRLVGVISSVRVRTVAVLCLAFTGAASGFFEPVPSGPDYTPVVAAHADKIKGHIVMFSGQRDADFIFAVRQVLGSEGFLVLRSSKVLYSCAGAPYSGTYVTYVSSAQEVGRAIEYYGPNLVFADRGDMYGGLQPERLLRQYLGEAEAYALIGSSLRHWPYDQGRYSPVDVYARMLPPHRTAEFVDLPIPMAGTHMRVDLKSLGF